MAASVKSGAKILIIGHNKIGKSHLINKFIGQDKAAGAAAGGAMIGSRFFGPQVGLAVGAAAGVGSIIYDLLPEKKTSKKQKES